MKTKSVDKLSPCGGINSPEWESFTRDSAINIFRSWKSDCWQGDLQKALRVYTDRELAEIREHGYNGIWLHQKLSDYTPSRLFAEFGTARDRYLDVLDRLIQRAQRHNIGVYLYLLEPRAIETNDPFWKNHTELRGQFWKQPGSNREYYALCSSHPTVKQYLHDSMLQLTRQLSGLAGFFVITAGEDFSTCICKLWKRSHFQRVIAGQPLTEMETDLSCPRCKARTIPEIISDLLNLLYDGIISGNPGCKMLAWDWGWDRLPYQRAEVSIVKRIHKDIIFLSDFEIGGSRTILGRKRPVNEYSLSYAGPSPRFLKHFRFSRKNGCRIGAKLQVGTTHELATVPNLPLIRSLYRKVAWARAAGLDAVLATWNMGNMRTLNTYAFGQSFAVSKLFNQHIFYHVIIRRYLGARESELLLFMRAWKCFEKAMNYYPYSTPFIYGGPINYAPAYWLMPRSIQGTPTGMSCDARERGDDLDSCRGGYTVEEIIHGFEMLITHWQRGMFFYRHALLKCRTVHAQEEYRSALCALCAFKSALNVYRLYEVCLRWDAGKSWKAYRNLCEQERDNCQTLLPILKRDKRLGFHAECQQFLFSEKLVKKKLAILSGYINNACNLQKNPLKNSRL
ncbi:MAG: hypothetical protein PHV34_08255 [Verrucomicrobiae bacterium]|nr:hypothetical protein [Verrucomicrobiae bacterium]